MVGEVRTAGLMAAVELVADKEPRCRLLRILPCRGGFAPAASDAA
jgi:adenosylmethionine-8-amino-7-oxononanoate aminotransferase